MNRNPWQRRQQWLLYDASAPDPQSRFDCDVAIIGSGAGGATAAASLSQRGKNVLIVEEGPLKTAKDFGKSEFASLDLYQDRGSRQSKDGSITILQGRTVGGSTTINWTSSFRLPASTLDHWREVYGIPWSLEDLQPYFVEMEQRLHIHDWEGEANANNRVLQEGAKALGLASQRIQRNVSGCQNLGYCGQGCPVNAKLSMLITSIPEALDAGAQLLYNCHVYKLQLSTTGQVKSILCFPSLGHGKVAKNPIEIHAKHFILAAGGIGSPGILLRSEAPDPYQRLGQRTCLHPVVVSGATMPHTINGFSGAPQTVYSDAFLPSLPEDELGFKLETSPIFPMLLAGSLPVYGTEHRSILEALPQCTSMLGLLRDGFHPDSSGGRVVLGDRQQPLLDYPWNRYLGEGARRALLAMAEIQFAAGAVMVLPFHSRAHQTKSYREAKEIIQEISMTPPYLKILSAHVMGGCGMAKAEADGVVNPQGRHHQIENLSIFDGSVFPTSLGVNPQLSIYGLVAMLSSALAAGL